MATVSEKTVMHIEEEEGTQDEAYAPAGGVSFFDELKADYENEKLETTLIKNMNPKMKRWAVELDNRMSYEDHQANEVKATKNKGRANETFNPAKAHALTIMASCVGIYRDVDGKWVQWKDSDGDAVTLNSIEFLESLGQVQGRYDVLAATGAFLGESLGLAKVFGPYAEFREWVGFGEAVENPTKG